MNKILKLSILFCLLASTAFSQSLNKVTLTLGQVINDAQGKSPSFYRSKNAMETSYWAYRNYRANILPQLSLQSTLPNFSRSINRITLPDGTDNFIEQNQANSTVNLSLSQNILATGGNLSLNSNLARLDVFSNDTLFYSSAPITVAYSQPVLTYNRLKWERKIAPIRYEEAQRGYVEDMEQIALEANNLFFNMLAAQIQLAISEKNKANTDTLFNISKGRYNLGKIAENDLLQMELSLLNSENSLAEARLNLEIQSQNLKRFLGIDTETDLELVLPSTVPNFEVSAEKALTEASNNRQAVLEFRRRRLEAEQQIAQAKGENGFNLSLNASFGLNQRGSTISDAYASPQDQQNLSVGITVPIVDWGVTKSRVRMAKANRELVEVDVQQDEVNFEQEIYLQVMRMNMQRKQLEIAAKADTIAQKRFEVTKQRYLIGKITITDLNIALTEKDNARLAYINSLQTFWNSYYTLRRLTLYDFVTNQKITRESEF